MALLGAFFRSRPSRPSLGWAIAIRAWGACWMALLWTSGGVADPPNKLPGSLFGPKRTIEDPQVEPAGMQHKLKRWERKGFPLPGTVIVDDPDSMVAPDCGGDCPLYFRKPLPHGIHKRREVMLENRLNEPDWYKYYRHKHYGYHAPVWGVWPEGWDSCRFPQGPSPNSIWVGPHPYDIKQPDPQGSAKKNDEGKNKKADNAKKGDI